MSALPPPTKRQLYVHAFMLSFRDEHGIWPSMREIAEAIGVSSTYSVHCHLVALKKKGLVAHRRNAARGWIALPLPSTEQAKGIYRKFEVKRADGSSGPGGKHEHCSYYVLDLQHDEFALPALRAYAKACRAEYPQLAEDIDEILAAEGPRCGCREAMCPHTPLFGPQNANEMAATLMHEAKELADA